MRRSLLIAMLLAVAIALPAQENVTVKFTAQTESGSYQPFTKVLATNMTRDWSETLIYPDTTLVMRNSTGVGEYNADRPCQLGAAFPNPFTGETRVPLELSKAGDVLLRVIRIDGSELLSRTVHMDAGSHHVVVNAASPGLTFLVALTPQGQSITKLVSQGSAGANTLSVEAVSIAANTKDNPDRGDVMGYFVLGDNMRYEALYEKDGFTYHSTIKEQAQNGDETMTLVFADTPPTAVAPTVTTADATDLTQTTATCGGNVINDGGVEVTERGVCWGTNESPTIDGEHQAGSTAGTGIFTVEITGLTPNTTYYVRAYARNSVDSAYGEQKSFTTLEELPPTPPPAVAPTVTTADATDLTRTTAMCGGNVINDGGAEVTERGVCWGTSENPSIDGEHQASSTVGIGVFTVEITGLTPNTTYYVRAYARNCVDIAYGEQKSFTTLEEVPPTPSWPDGILPGNFSVSETLQVQFSQGNLQYNKTTNEWSFMECQYDMVETDAQNVGEYYADQNIVSLFGWGTSGYNHGANCYQPWSTSDDYSDYYAYGSDSYNLYDQTGKADWGYNAIINGGNATNTWRTLTKDEWVYIFDTRTTTSGIRYAKARVNNVNGMILLPDDWSTSYYTLNSTNLSNASFNSNTITASQWSTLEQHGAVFLPAAGYRNGTSVDNVGSFGCYLSASKNDSYYAYYVNFRDGYLYPQEYNPRYYGRSVRLVSGPAAPTPPPAVAPTVTTTGVMVITQTSGTCGGEVTDDGGAEVTERGVCWSTSENPTIDGEHQASSAAGIGAFTVNITGLTPNTTYYVRAYAKNEVDVAYGEQKTFTTLEEIPPVPSWPNGTLPGNFSVSETLQVQFSQGNLQYNMITSEWSFMERQYDMAETDDLDLDENYANQNIVSLFGWGTSDYNHGAVCWHPWSTSTNSGDYYAYGDITYNLYDQTGQADWGYNAIINGGDTENQWRTLTMHEWTYVFDTRSTASGIRYAKACVNNVNGVILLPDDWNESYYTLNSTNTGTASFNSNTITALQWSTLEQHGAVFLPATGFRKGTFVYDVGYDGSYWSTSCASVGRAFGVYFNDLGLSLQDQGGLHFGQSVRLVSGPTIPPAVAPTVTTADATDLTQTTVTCGGQVTDDGGAEVTECGVCWSTSENPTINGVYQASSTAGIGTFTVEITGLTPNTTYYVRAYARNSVDVAYGEQKSFTTLEDLPTIPEGAIDAQFSVSASDQVYFSMGNLQYQASTGTWKFAEHQYDYIGNDNSNISPSYSGWIDLFGWGTSGYHNSNDPYNTNYQPWSSSMNMVNSTYNYYGYGPSANMSSLDLTENSAEYDWGVHNAISNGGNMAGLWRTMTDNEWLYLLYERSTSTVNGVTNARYAKAKVADKNGLILFPDTYTHPANVAQPVGINDTGNTGWNGNSYSAADWTLMEQAGCVFLPAAGYRRVNAVERPGIYGSYMSVTHSGIDNFHSTDFIDTQINDNVDGRFYGISVRLVHGTGTNISVNTPTVSTSDVTNVTATEATCGGIVINDCGYPVTERGVCWSEYWNPDLSNAHTINGSGTGSFTSQITGLTPGTTYNVRAYATNSEGTSYGMNMTFTTPVPAPEGAIDGLFTINGSGNQVYFSQGNLQFKASSGTWRFATNQYDYIGDDNSNISSSYSGWIDLFGWGTSGWNCGNTYYHPWDSGTSCDECYGPLGQYNLTGSYANSDWGVYNPISNGGNTSNMWRTLTHEEWRYVFDTRNTNSGIRYAKAKVNDVNGIILLPDNWSASYYTLNNTNTYNAGFDSNVITASQWTNSLQLHGAVFLPAAGYRYHVSVEDEGRIGKYWSVSYDYSYNAYDVYISDHYFSANSTDYRYYGQSVRLVFPAL